MRRPAASAGDSAYHLTSDADGVAPAAGPAATVIPSSPSRPSSAVFLPATFFAAFPAGSASMGSGAAPAGACASSSTLAAWRAAFASGVTFGNRGSISIRVCASTAAAATRANGLSSAGMTYQGAHGVLVLLSTSLNAFW